LKITNRLCGGFLFLKIVMCLVLKKKKEGEIFLINFFNLK